MDGILASIGLADKPMIVVMNKIDQVKSEKEKVKSGTEIFVSAVQKTGLDDLKSAIAKSLA